MIEMDMIHYHIVNVPSTHHHFTQKREIKLRREYKNVLNIIKFDFFSYARSIVTHNSYGSI